MSRKSQIIVLCEDKQHKCFSERLLRQLGFRNYRTLPVPGCSGSGGAYVDKLFPAEVEEQRRRNATGGLLVVRDADNWTVAQRLGALGQSLPTPRGATESIAIFIPKWEIETWIAYLRTKQDVDENCKDYPKLKGHEAACHPCVDRFLEIAQAGSTPDNCPPSLRRTIEDEYLRIASLRT